jgi:hypothetical protein
VSRECTETDGAAPTTAHEPSWIARLTALRDGTTTDHFVADMALAQQGRVFGGLIAAQALAAASRTVAPEALPQSLHLTLCVWARPAAFATRSSGRVTADRSPLAA